MIAADDGQNARLVATCIKETAPICPENHHSLMIAAVGCHKHQRRLAHLQWLCWAQLAAVPADI